MTRIHMSTGVYYDVDYDVDNALTGVKVLWDTPHATFVEFDRWLRPSYGGFGPDRYRDGRLVLNVNHIVRLAPL